MHTNRTLLMWVLLIVFVGCLAVWAASPAGDIVQVASKDKDLSTFVKAVREAGLTGALSAPGPFTVFAPTDEAFRKIPASTLTSLLKPENKAQLRSLLLYHVVKGRETAPALLKAKSPMTLTTIEGAKIRVTHTGKRVMVGNATVTKADIMAKNGVIHKINNVLMPPAQPHR